MRPRSQPCSQDFQRDSSFGDSKMGSSAGKSSGSSGKKSTKSGSHSGHATKNIEKVEMKYHQIQDGWCGGKYQKFEDVSSLTFAGQFQACTYMHSTNFCFEKLTFPHGLPLWQNYFKTKTYMNIHLFLYRFRFYM